MQTENETIHRWESGWAFRYRPSRSDPPRRIIVFIHGWTGDEFSMVIFAHQPRPDDVLIFPRGPVNAAPSGFGWAPHQPSIEPAYDQFVPTAHKLARLLESLTDEIHPLDPQLTLVGFSQGAAMAFTLASLYPERIKRLACLAGFLPKDYPLGATSFSGRPIFIAHGRNDDTIPIQTARQMAAALQNAGAEVKYCESSAGHKLSTSCFQQLSEFINPRQRP